MKIADVYKEIEIYIDNISLNGKLRIPENMECKGIILFSHGSGSSRLSNRNNFIANLLLDEGYASLLIDLLTTEEDLVYENRFDIDLLTDRLLKVAKWVRNYKHTKHLPIALFGASCGAASALNAAAYLGNKIKAVVLRSGRPDLVTYSLMYITAPTLFIVGGNDQVVVELNKRAKDQLNCHSELKIIEGASHLFTEIGKLEIVTKLSNSWFDKYLNNKVLY
jgi:pimeloyl-ACP methyl ester carboxylesterase